MNMSIILIDIMQVQDESTSIIPSLLNSYNTEDSNTTKTEYGNNTKSFYKGKLYIKVL